MKESIWGYWIIVLGLAILSVMIVLQNLTVTSQDEYYLLRETLETSMLEAVDYAYYRDTGRFKMDAEKFVENFIRRFANGINMNTKTYNIRFYDIYEDPPAASVAIATTAAEGRFGTADNIEMNAETRLTAILYTDYGFTHTEEGYATWQRTKEKNYG